MNQDEGFQQMMLEREQGTIAALNRCLKAGADPDDIKDLARECGIDIKYLTLSAYTRTASVG